MVAASHIASPAGEPAIRRKFQLTNLEGNNNKYYLIETWLLPGGDVFFRATYGRVGARPQIDEKVTKHSWVDQKIREKLARGYREVTLHRPSTDAVRSTTPVRERKIDELIDFIFAEAGSQIASFLAVGVDALSSTQLAEGRALLNAIQHHYFAWQQTPNLTTRAALVRDVEAFYNTIPTILPSRIDLDQVVQRFCREIAEQEDRLNQLEAALATFTSQQSRPTLSLYDALGAEISLLSTGDQRYADIYDYIDRTTVHGYRVRVRDVFTITVPAERRAWETNPRGLGNRALLFHGTANQNICHILRSGLICPRMPSHGRMFGHGIYFANKCTKSANYCAATRRNLPTMLFLAEVALGKQWIAKDAMTSLSAAPEGYDSVWGKAGHTGAWLARLGYDEFVVYRPEQQTLRYLVTFDR